MGCFTSGADGGHAPEGLLEGSVHMPAAVAIRQVLQQEARRGIALSPAQGALAADSNTADLQTAMGSIHVSLFFKD